MYQILDDYIINHYCSLNFTVHFWIHWYTSIHRVAVAMHVWMDFVLTVSVSWFCFRRLRTSASSCQSPRGRSRRRARRSGSWSWPTTASRTSWPTPRRPWTRSRTLSRATRRPVPMARYGFDGKCVVILRFLLISCGIFLYFFQEYL